ncbi:U-box domain-containing protein 27-like [Curcuma longa]|uniref:U-box domain-containing protein 27-like n=1 Tax=Curcuma longa TaxID=136217 RepID=UPI003D9F3223
MSVQKRRGRYQIKLNQNMGRRREKGGRLEGLEVNLPCFFRCPISLEVMRSPVSLCTGVTYDRSSIQSWFDSGHRTCPATRLPLPSPVHLVPNLTLRRLIRLWSSSSSCPAILPTTASPSHHPAPSVDDFLLQLRSISPFNPLPLLRHLSAFFSSSRDSDQNRLTSSPFFAPALVSFLTDRAAGPEVPRLAIKIIALVLEMDRADDRGRESAIKALLADLDGAVAALIESLRNDQTQVGSGIDAAKVLDAILSSSSCDGEKRISIVENPDFFPELIRLLVPRDDEGCGGAVNPESADAGIRCLLAAAKGRRARARMARAGAVPTLTRILVAAEVPAATAERALLAMEAAAGSGEGRAAICEEAESCVAAVMGRLMKVGREGREAAVAVLWTACVAEGDRRAREAVAGAKGGAAKILMVMQGECSPATARMAGELLRIFKVDTKGCCVGYDTKTTHIMPY